MNKAKNLMDCCKKIYENGDISSKTALMMAQRYLVSAVVLDNKNLYHTAFHTVKSMLSKNPSDLGLVMMEIYINIELGAYELADKHLNELLTYKSYFKLSEPLKYGSILYLQSLNEYRTERTRSAYKYFRNLKEYADETPAAHSLMLMGALKIEFGEVEEAGAFLSGAYDKGLRSSFFFLTLNKYFGTLYSTLPFTEKLLIPFLNWGLSHDADLSKIVETYMDKIALNFFYNTDVGIKLYKIYPNSLLLKEICRVLINDYDYSERAYYFYAEAMMKQIELNNLNDYLVRSSFRNNKEQLNVYSVKQFLKSEEMQDEIVPYIYHVMLSNKKYGELVSEYHTEIILFGVRSLETGKSGRYYNSVYKYILDNDETEQIPDKFITLAEERLYTDLLSFEIEVRHSGVDYIWINEKEKSEMSVYAVSSQKACIKASSDTFQYYCYVGEGIVDSDITVTRLIQNEDVKLYTRCYLKKHISDELLIVLSKYYLNQEEPPIASVDILKKTAAEVKISKSFRMKIIAAIGNIYYSYDKPDEALDFYKMVDENYLNDRNIDQMATILTEAGQMDKVLKLLLNKADCLTDKTLFYVVKALSKNEKYHAQIANAGYELLLKSWYDRKLIDIVLKHYRGSQEEWQQLSAVLNSMGIQDKGLDELIVKNGIWMHKFDVGIQQVFRNIYGLDNENECIDDFVTFCGYEVIVNKTRIQSETVAVLEKVFLKTRDKYLSFILSHIYIEQGLSTANSTEIINEAVSNMENDKILFPVFKEAKDKSYSAPYIEKNHPFIYRAIPNKNVILNFRTDKEFFHKKMKYVFFGLYMTAVPHFYNEEIEFYVTEEMHSGSIETRKQRIYNGNIYIYEDPDDPYFDINNAVIYDKMFKYDKVEQIITEKTMECAQIRGQII